MGPREDWVQALFTELAGRYTPAQKCGQDVVTVDVRISGVPPIVCRFPVFLRFTYRARNANFMSTKTNPKYQLSYAPPDSLPLVEPGNRAR